MRHYALQEHGSLEVIPLYMTKMRHHFGLICLLDGEVPTLSESYGVLGYRRRRNHIEARRGNRSWTLE